MATTSDTALDPLDFVGIDHLLSDDEKAIRDAVREVKKVVWPERKEAMQITAYVFGFVVVMAIFLWFTDKTLEFLMYDLLLGWKK